MNVFQRAITVHGDVDPGYLAIYWALIGWSVAGLVVIGAAVIKGWAATPAEVVEMLKAVGAALRDVAIGFSTVVGAVGLYRWGDKQPNDSTKGGTA